MGVDTNVVSVLFLLGIPGMTLYVLRNYLFIGNH